MRRRLHGDLHIDEAEMRRKGGGRGVWCELYWDVLDVKWKSDCMRTGLYDLDWKEEFWNGSRASREERILCDQRFITGLYVSRLSE